MPKRKNYNLNTTRRGWQRHRRMVRRFCLVTISTLAIISSLVIVFVLSSSRNSDSKKVNNGLIVDTSNVFYDENKVESTVEMMPVSGVESENNKIPDEKPIIDSGYDYTKPVPESHMVGDDYFDDAVFIGDSRTEGLLLYTKFTNAISYTHKGLMVDTVFTSPVINKGGEKLSVMDALRQTNFSKVYIMLGINETGWTYNEVFIKQYGKVIDEIKTINPQAIIYVQEILPVADSVSKTHSYVKNEKINEYNALIRKMAEEKEIYYIDIGSAVADGNGCLPEEAAVDGIHLKKYYCEQWLEYLKTHTIPE